MISIGNTMKGLIGNAKGLVSVYLQNVSGLLKVGCFFHAKVS